jgi:hypothetical protein
MFTTTATPMARKHNPKSEIAMECSAIVLMTSCRIFADHGIRIAMTPKRMKKIAIKKLIRE